MSRKSVGKYTRRRRKKKTKGKKRWNQKRKTKGKKIFRKKRNTRRKPSKKRQRRRTRRRVQVGGGTTEKQFNTAIYLLDYFYILLKNKSFKVPMSEAFANEGAKIFLKKNKLELEKGHPGKEEDFDVILKRITNEDLEHFFEHEYVKKDDWKTLDKFKQFLEDFIVTNKQGFPVTPFMAMAYLGEWITVGTVKIDNIIKNFGTGKMKEYTQPFVIIYVGNRWGFGIGKHYKGPISPLKWIQESKIKRQEPMGTNPLIAWKYMSYPPNPLEISSPPKDTVVLIGKNTDGDDVIRFKANDNNGTLDLQITSNWDKLENYKLDFFKMVNLFLNIQKSKEEQDAEQAVPIEADLGELEKIDVIDLSPTDKGLWASKVISVYKKAKIKHFSRVKNIIELIEGISRYDAEVSNPNNLENELWDGFMKQMKKKENKENFYLLEELYNYVYREHMHKGVIKDMEMHPGKMIEAVKKALRYFDIIKHLQSKIEQIKDMGKSRDMTKKIELLLGIYGFNLFDDLQKELLDDMTEDYKSQLQLAKIPANLRNNKNWSTYIPPDTLLLWADKALFELEEYCIMYLYTIDIKYMTDTSFSSDEYNTTNSNIDQACKFLQRFLWEEILLKNNKKIVINRNRNSKFNKEGEWENWTQEKDENGNFYHKDGRMGYYDEGGAFVVYGNIGDENWKLSNVGDYVYNYGSIKYKGYINDENNFVYYYDSTKDEKQANILVNQRKKMFEKGWIRLGPAVKGGYWYKAGEKIIKDDLK